MTQRFKERVYRFGSIAVTETWFTTGTMYTDKLFTRWVECAAGVIETNQRDVGLGVYHYGARFYSPKLGRFLSPDTIVPGAFNPQNLNRFSYVLNNPIKLVDPSGHRCIGEDEECTLDDGSLGAGFNGNGQISGSNKSTAGGCVKGSCGGKGGGKGDGNDIVITLSRDELDKIQDAAVQLADDYGQQGAAWAYGTGAVASGVMGAVDYFSCAAAVASAGVLTGGCVVSLFLTFVVVPGASILVGDLGGNTESQDFDTVGDYINEALADNPQMSELTITVETNSQTVVMLPGGVGPTFTNYTIQINGMESPVTLSGYAGGDVISTLFGVVP